MKLFRVSLVPALLLSASPVWAADGDTYVGVDVGASVGTSYRLTFTEPGGTVNTGNVNEKTGLDLDIVAGHDFGLLRLEGELAWKRAPHKSFTNLDNGTTGGLAGHTQSLSLMANALIAVPAGPVTLFAGPGIGWSHNSIRIEDVNSGIILDKKSDRLAWQIQAGAEFPVSKGISLSVKYRYFETRMSFDDADINPTDTNQYNLSPHTHSILAGIRFNF